MAAKANKKSSRRARKGVGRRIMLALALGSKSRGSARRSRTRKSGKRGYTIVRALRVPVEGYCRNCKGHRAIASPSLVKMANGGPAVLGKCSECGRGMFRFGAPPEKKSTTPPARRSQAEPAPVPVLDSILRSPKGNVRNFRAMSDGKLLNTLDAVLAGKLNESDPEGYEALLRVMGERGDSRADVCAVVVSEAQKSARRSAKPAAAAPVKYDGRLRVGGSERMRNFARMSDANLAALVKATKGTSDTEARKALLAVARERRAAAKQLAAA